MIARMTNAVALVCVIREEGVTAHVKDALRRLRQPPFDSATLFFVVSHADYIRSVGFRVFFFGGGGVGQHGLFEYFLK